MVTIYAYDKNGVYTNTAEVDPMGEVPAGLMTAPPALTGTEVAQAVGGVWVVLPEYPNAPLSQRQTAAWERIKHERDRRKVLGVKVGAHWYHSDDSSRIQQLALAMMGAAIPAGLQWKTLTTTSPPVFVEMTPALAQGIFQATAASDAAIFAAAEAHRVAMEAMSDPENYDFSGGWPASIGDAP